MFETEKGGNKHSHIKETDRQTDRGVYALLLGLFVVYHSQPR